MKRFFSTLFFTVVVVVSLQQTTSANTISITSSTNWSAINSGSGASGQPGTGDAITVSNGATLTVDVTNGVCASLTLGSGSTAGALTFVNTGTQSLTVNGTITVGSGTAGGTGTIHLLSVGKLTCGGLSLSSTSTASVYGDGGTLTINGTITVGSGGTYSWQPANGTVVIGATSTLPAGTVFSQFYNLTINPGSGNTVTTGADMSVNNNLTISSGTLADPSLPIHGNTGGTLTMAAGTNLTLGDPASSTGVQFPSIFTTAHIALDPTSTVVYQANAAQTVSNIPAYGNLTLTSGAASTAKTAGGALTVNGNFTLLAAPVQFNAGTSLNHTIKGDWSNSSTHATPFTYTTASTITFNGTAAQTIGGTVVTAFNNLTISNTAASVSAGANLTVSGTLTVNSSSTLDMKTYTLSVGIPSISGTINTQNTSGTPISSGKTWGGIVNFNGSGIKYVPAGTYATVKANAGSASVLLAGQVDITTLVIGDQTSTNFWDEGYPITTAQNLTIVSGTYVCQAGIFPWATSTVGGTVDYNGGAQTVASKTYTNLTVWGTTTKTLAASDAIVVTGTLTVNSGTTLAFGTTAQTLALTGTGSGTLVNNGTIDMSTGPNAAHVLQVAGSNVSFGTLISGTGSKIEYTSATGGQSIGSLTYNNLQLDNTSGTNTAAGNLIVNGSLSIASGTLDMGTYSLSAGTALTSGTINTQNASSTPIPAGMTWGGTINFNGSSSQNVPTGTYANLQLNNALGAALTGNVNVTGTLTMASGNLTTTNGYNVSFGTSGTLSGEGSGHYIVGNLIMDEVIGSSASSSRLNGIGVSISSGSDDLGTVEINRVSGKAGQATVNSGEGIDRKWSITSSNSTATGRNMTLTWVSDDVPYGYSLTSAQVWNSINSGSSWSSVGSAEDLSSNTVTVPFTSSAAPTMWTVSANESSPAHNALLFGGNQYVVTQPSSALKTTTMTVEAWIKPASSPSGTEEICRLKSSSTDDGFELVLNTDGSLKVSYLAGFGAGWTYAQSSGVNVLDNNWHHVALTLYSPNGYNLYMYLYVDGETVISVNGEYTSLEGYASNVQMYLGAHPGPYQYYSGLTAEVRIWNTARSQADIQSTMHTTLSGTESRLIGYWPLSGESGTTTSSRDLVNSNNGTLQGFTFSGNGWVTSTAPVGAGTSTDIANFTSGTANLGTVSLTTTSPFSNSVNLVGTEITTSPNSLPASPGTLLSDRYWIITPYGTPGASYSTNLTFTVPSWFTNNGAEPGSTYILYHRNDNSDGSWTTTVSGALAVTATTIEFDGITSFSQFVIGSSDNALPVELVSFTANNPGGKVELLWKTATEVNNYGFEVERTSPIPSPYQGEGGEAGRGWVKIGFVKGSGNSNSPKSYSFVDNNPLSGNASYRLKQIDNSGCFKYSSIVTVNTLPTKFELCQNYPNPFNPSTTIHYEIPNDGLVTLKIFDVLGREVKTLVNGYQQQGKYSVNFSADNLASGVYICRLQAGSYSSIKKLMLIK